MKKSIHHHLIYILTLVCLANNIGLIHAQDVIAVSDPAITTDKLTSGELIIGINTNGGGVINYFEIPGIGNIFGPQSVLYGRSGQSAMRDGMHSGRYNPTQAGFNETLGTPCIVEKTNRKFTLPARPVALWYGDCKWDFTEWENIGPDPTCYPDGGNSDVDQLDESNLEGKQNTEVKSEFDYFGLYHNYNSMGNIDISCVRHYFEYRYVREPGHCINQFRPGLDIFNVEAINPDISTAYPTGTHTAEPFDMSNFILSWHLRNDVVKWDPKYHFIPKPDGSWSIQDREVYVKETLDNNGDVIVPRLLIISDSNNPDTKNAIGLYMPDSEFNAFETIGVDENTGLIEYKDKRNKSIRIWDQPRRIPTMAVYGFKTETKGILNRTRLPQNIYEAYRFDMFILMGSPNEIWETIDKIENAKTVWNFNSDIENWTFSGGEVTLNDGSIKLTTAGSNPELLSPDKLLVDAALHKFVSFRIKNNTPQEKVKISFKRYGGSETFFHDLEIQPNLNTWQTYSVNISSNENWIEMIQQIGINLSASAGNFEIDLIAVSADGKSDCNGDFNGSAYIDACNNCVEGNTGNVSCEDCMGVSNGGATINSCGDCVGGTSPTNPTNEWHFNSLSNWDLNPRLSGYSNSGYAILSVSGVDPYMNYTGTVCIDTKVVNTIKLNIKNNTNGTAASIYYQNDVSNSWNFKSISLSMDDDEIKTYSVDMTGDENWVGNIHKIRFDPPGTSGSLLLDYLAVQGGSTGIGDIEKTKSGISLYPNPASKIFYVKTEIESSIVVFDSRGTEVYHNNNLQQKHTVETENWNVGLYVVKVINSKDIQFFKSIIH